MQARNEKENLSEVRKRIDWLLKKFEESYNSRKKEQTTRKEYFLFCFPIKM